MQLQLDEEQLRVVPVRRDEGFESDSEGSSGSACEDPCCAPPPEDKVTLNTHAGLGAVFLILCYIGRIVFITITNIVLFLIQRQYVYSFLYYFLFL